MLTKRMMQCTKGTHFRRGTLELLYTLKSRRSKRAACLGATPRGPHTGRSKHLMTGMHVLGQNVVYLVRRCGDLPTWLQLSSLRALLWIMMYLPSTYGMVSTLSPHGIVPHHFDHPKRDIIGIFPKVKTSDRFAFADRIRLGMQVASF